eukprot:CAMPEP_0113396912 /NCGR_PEP_ID=MMETSP0013_2-20120614/14072_1 /TAXON_ID=2843 ORGANISM="Skeletonema costatum, Strain 1716" /NCGR_SAMPLE_ID=MMETSP0013_2 /ASSEMBLY_ACC=CAM_ASM_000158 /LENGTH=650 /DNA_ID=CAMNT_0000281405 /DNA_START=112 /DNA_END=2064 /DNA_ORIENTATION=- /assembly_acc=CAM_ASM_000158
MTRTLFSLTAALVGSSSAFTQSPSFSNASFSNPPMTGTMQKNTFLPAGTDLTRRSFSTLSESASSQSSSPRHSMLFAKEMSTYDIDTDENAEQSLADNPITYGANGQPSSPQTVNGDAGNVANRYSSVLESMDLNIPSLKELPSQRAISSNDVFCNRELRLDNIRAIGFDMDYTLAQYQQPNFDKLAFDGAKEKLVNSLGYPKEVLDFEYDHTYWVRGLIIDTARGNFLKIDRHKYVRMAYHGFSPISSNMRKQIYSKTFNKQPSFTEKGYVNMDTLFQHVDAHLFALLVEMKDFGEHEFLDMRTYEEIYRQVRECVDLCHRDGVIKDEVARDPEKYLVLDDGLLPMLRQYRENGIKVFLLTNSYWEYTSTAMNYLYHEKKVDEETQKKNEWTELFDLVVVGACKPAYLKDPYLNLFRVEPEDGSLKNTDGLFEIEALGEGGAEKFLEMGKCFQGGNWNHLQAMLETTAGEEIIYVGDHLYADVLRSKRALGWRSCFIMPELPEEMRIFNSQVDLRKSIMQLRSLRDELGAYADTMRLEMTKASFSESRAMEKKIEQIEEDDGKIKEKLSEAHRQYHSAFHPRWGQMFVAGYQDSRFGYFVKNYACLYTSKATNLGLASAARAFRTSGELLPHDNMLSRPSTEFVDAEVE